MAGNANSGKRKDKLFFEALLIEINKTPDKKRLRSIASKLLQMAEDGDIQAIKEIGNRLDGTPAQTMDMNVNDNRQPRELTDADLADIAAGSRDGIASPQEGTQEPDSVH